jgi:cation-transporting ATPase 13A1
VGGDGLAWLHSQGLLAECVHTVRVFARATPDQKELVLGALKAAGLTTLMCGDGTNDVGALKMAHCGVALLQVGCVYVAFVGQRVPAKPLPFGPDPARRVAAHPR